MTTPAPRSRRWLLRRGLSWLVLGAALYPVFRFLSFAVPKKPVRVKVDTDPGLRGFVMEPTFILFHRQGKTWAVSRRCTHLGCTLSYNEAIDQLVCPCHQSHFSTTGQRLAGPAQRHLAVYQVEPAPDGGQGYIVTI